MTVGSPVTINVNPAVGRTQRAALCVGDYSVELDARPAGSPVVSSSLTFDVPSDFPKTAPGMAQPLRLQVFRALVVVGDSGLTPGAIQEALGVAPATLSFHLKELVNAGLVTQQRASRNLVYRAAFEQMNAVLAYLTENCCQGVGCAVDSPAASCTC